MLGGEALWWSQSGPGWGKVPLTGRWEEAHHQSAGVGEKKWGREGGRML